MEALMEGKCQDHHERNLTLSSSVILVTSFEGLESHRFARETVSSVKVLLDDAFGGAL